MAQRHQASLQSLPSNQPKTLKIAALVLAVLGAVGLMAAPPLGVILLVGALFCFLNSSKAAKRMAESTLQMSAEYSTKLAEGQQRIDAALSEWERARRVVQEFEREQLRDVVA